MPLPTLTHKLKSILEAAMMDDLLILFWSMIVGCAFYAALLEWA